MASFRFSSHDQELFLCIPTPLHSNSSNPWQSREVCKGAVCALLLYILPSSVIGNSHLIQVHKIQNKKISDARNSY